MNWMVMVLRNGIECRAQCSDWGVPWFCWSDPWRKAKLSLHRFGPQQEGKEVDAELRFATASAHITQQLRDLELVKFGHSTRDDIHDKSEENGRIDLVFKAKDGRRRATMVHLLFRKPSDARTFADGDWYNTYSGVQLAPVIALGLKELCKYYVSGWK
jgi:hypothetical protein